MRLKTLPVDITEDKIVAKVHKDFFRIDLEKLTLFEFKILFAMISHINGRGDGLCQLNLYDLSDVANSGNASPGRIKKSLSGLSSKLQVSETSPPEDESSCKPLFTTLYFNEPDNKVYIQVDSGFSYLFNDLSDDTVNIQISEINKIKTIAAIRLFVTLSEFNRDGGGTFTEDDLKSRLYIPDYADSSKIKSRYIVPAVKELEPIVKRIRYERRKNRYGQNVYKFTIKRGKKERKRSYLEGFYSIEKMRYIFKGLLEDESNMLGHSFPYGLTLDGLLDLYLQVMKKHEGDPVYSDVSFLATALYIDNACGIISLEAIEYYHSYHYYPYHRMGTGWSLLEDLLTEDKRKKLHDFIKEMDLT